MRKVNPRQARRMMRKMGLNMNPLDVQEVILKTKDMEINIKDPEVAVLEMQGQKIFQVIGGEINEKKLQKSNPLGSDKLCLFNFHHHFIYCHIHYGS